MPSTSAGGEPAAKGRRICTGQCHTENEDDAALINSNAAGVSGLIWLIH